MKTGEGSYESVINSFGITVITTTLLVSLGKLISSNYFLYVIVFFLIILVILTLLNQYMHEKRIGDQKFVDCKMEEEDVQVKNSLNEIFINTDSSNTEPISINVDPIPPPRQHLNVPHTKKEINLRKLALLKNFSPKEGNMYLKEGERKIARHSSIKYHHTKEHLKTYSIQEWREHFSMAQKRGNSLLKEQTSNVNMKKVLS